MAFFAKKEKSCCGCFSVKAGTQIIVWIFLVVAIMKLRANVEYMSVLDHMVHEFVQRNVAPTTVTACMEWVMWICVSSVLVFQLVPSVLALYGAYMRKSSYLQPFILINTVNIVNLLGGLLFLAGTFIIVCMNRSGLEEDVYELIVKKHNESHPKDPMPEDANETILTVVISVLGLGFILLGVFTLVLYHFVCVVHTHYLKLKEEKESYKYNAFSNLFPENGKKPLA